MRVGKPGAGTARLRCLAAFVVRAPGDLLDLLQSLVAGVERRVGERLPKALAELLARQCGADLTLDDRRLRDDRLGFDFSVHRLAARDGGARVNTSR